MRQMKTVKLIWWTKTRSSEQIGRDARILGSIE